MNDRVVTHNGLIGMLEANEIDIALTDLSLTYQRGKVIVKSPPQFFPPFKLSDSNEISMSNLKEKGTLDIEEHFL